MSGGIVARAVGEIRVSTEPQWIGPSRTMLYRAQIDIEYRNGQRSWMTAGGITPELARAKLERRIEEELLWEPETEARVATPPDHRAVDLSGSAPVRPGAGRFLPEGLFIARYKDGVLYDLADPHGRA